MFYRLYWIFCLLLFSVQSDKNSISLNNKYHNGDNSELATDFEFPTTVLQKELYWQNERPENHKISDNMIGKPLSPEDFEAGLNLTEEYMSPPDQDPLQLSGYFEGDIKDPDFVEERNAIRDARMKWYDGVLPYVISNTFSPQERSVIARAVEEYQQRTCIRFIPRRGHQDYVFITRGNGCFSMIGRVGGEQMLSLDHDCVYVGIVIHEFMHAVGFWHEQSRTDRDNFVQILWDNIQPGQQFNFEKYTDGRLHHLGEHYDYDSIMHYGTHEFSVGRNRPTIIPRARGVNIGQRRGFSLTDVRKINKLYQCPPTREDGGCFDKNEQCRGWAARGECLKNPRWMMENCRLSCDNCNS